MATMELDLGRAVRSLRRRLSKLGGVACVYLFGSMARGDTSSLSDIDLAVLLRPSQRGDLPKAMEALMRVFGGKADISDLEALPLSIQFRVVKEGTLLYVADESVRARFEAKVIDEYLDMEPHREEYLEELFRYARSSRL